MRPINARKKCMKCGKYHEISEQDRYCQCGGFLYIVNEVYQKKTETQESEGNK